MICLDLQSPAAWTQSDSQYNSLTSCSMRSRIGQRSICTMGGRTDTWLGFWEKSSTSFPRWGKEGGGALISLLSSLPEVRWAYRSLWLILESRWLCHISGKNFSWQLLCRVPLRTPLWEGQGVGDHWNELQRDVDALYRSALFQSRRFSPKPLWSPRP